MAKRSQKFVIFATPPSINSYKITSKRTHKQILAPRVRNFIKEVYYLAKEQQLRLYKGVLGVNIRYFFKNKRRRDVDNFHKALIDGLKGVAFIDDVQIKFLTLEKYVDTKHPRTEVIIVEL